MDDPLLQLEKVLMIASHVLEDITAMPQDYLPHQEIVPVVTIALTMNPFPLQHQQVFIYFEDSGSSHVI